MEIPWAPSSAWPLWDHADPDFLVTPGPHEAVAEDGTRYTLQRDTDNQRCGERDYRRDMFCMMMAGHDGPHLPMSRELAAMQGPLIVLSVSRKGKSRSLSFPSG